MFSNQIDVIFFRMARFAVSFQMQDVFNINILLSIKVKKKNPVSQYIHIVQFTEKGRGFIIFTTNTYFN